MICGVVFLIKLIKLINDASQSNDAGVLMLQEESGKMDWLLINLGKQTKSLLFHSHISQ